MTTTEAPVAVPPGERPDVRTPDEAEEFLRAVADTPMNRDAADLVRLADVLAAKLREFAGAYDENSINAALDAAGHDGRHALSVEGFRATARTLLRDAAGFGWACEQFGAACGSTVWE